MLQSRHELANLLRCCSPLLISLSALHAQESSAISPSSASGSHSPHQWSFYLLVFVGTLSVAAVGHYFYARRLRARTERLTRLVEEGVQNLQLILNSTAEAIYGVDEAGNCTFCNQASLRTFGYADPADLLGKNLHSLVHHSYADGTPYPLEKCPIFTALRSGEASHFDCDVLWRADGTWFPAECWSYPIRRNGVVSGCVVTLIDISQRKAAERALRLAHEESELFINAVPSILVGLDAAGKIARWNATAEATFGLAEEEVLGKSVIDCGITWSGPDNRAEVASWPTTSITRRVDNLLFEKAGEKRILCVTLKPLRMQDHATDGLLITGADTTERRTLEEQLRQAQKLEAIGELAAGIAHEINTPTQFVGDNVSFIRECWTGLDQLIAGARELRQQAGPFNLDAARQFDYAVEQIDLSYVLQEVPRALDQTLDGVQRVSSIVRAMKEFSHPGSGEKQLTDINRAVTTTVTIGRSAWKYVADLHTDLDPNLPPVPCFAGDINQVLLNLIVNAAHAISDAVAGGARGRGQITIRTRAQRDAVQIAIEDNGTGIPERIRHRIFEPFFTTKSVGQGTGQGLTLAHTVIVKKHGGRIWFESEIGKGTSFFICLPMESTASKLGCGVPENHTGNGRACPRRRELRGAEAGRHCQ